MSTDKPSISQVLYSNRSLVMVLLGVPVFGMLIAVALILYKRPDNTAVALGVILFVAVQYILMMFFFMKRVESLAKKRTEEAMADKESIHESIEEIQIVSRIDQLLPEEKRIFDAEEKEKAGKTSNE